MWEVVKTLAEKLTGGVLAGVILIAFGAALIVGASVGGLPHYGLALPELGWRFFIAAAGLVFIFAGLYLILFDRDAKVKSQNRTPDVKSLEISIKSAGQSVENPATMMLEGTSKEIPSGYELWLVSADSGGRKRYWPMGRLFPEEGEWSYSHDLKDWKQGHERHYVVYLVGMNGKALCDYYRTAGELIDKMNRNFLLLKPDFKLDPETPGHHWPELTELTSDMFVAASRRLKLVGRPKDAERSKGIRI